MFGTWLLLARKQVKMSITGEMCEYFQNLLKPLATNKSLEKLLSSLQKEIKNVDKKYNEQNKKMEQLESTIALMQNALGKLDEN